MPPAGVNVAAGLPVLLNCVGDKSGPLVTVHAPVPTDGVLAANVALAVEQMVWLMPAFEAVGSKETTISTSSVLTGQAPLVIVQRSVAVAPGTNPVRPETGDEGVVMVAVPETTLQLPVPITGVLPESVAIVTLQSVWSGPAFEGVGGSSTVIVTFEVLGVHGALVIVHVNT